MIRASTQGIALNHIQPRKPQQNAYIEHYNRARHWARTNGAFNGSLLLRRASFWTVMVWLLDEIYLSGSLRGWGSSAIS